MDRPDERRAARRVRRRFILRVAAFGEQPPLWSLVTIHNLSSTGALFTYDKPVRVGLLMLFRIDFPGRVIECMGRVRRLADAREHGCQDVGASFEGIRPQDKKYIDDFIEKSGLK